MHIKHLNLTTLLIFAVFVVKAQTKNFLDQSYLEVAGTADTLVTPDEIYIKININEKDAKDRTSVEELEDRMYEILQGLPGDVAKNLTISDMASNFKSYILRGKEIEKSKQYLLKVRDAVTATRVFIELEKIGISNTSIDRVRYSDLEAMKNQMRTKAVENARTGARALVKPLNQSIGSAIHIQDFNPGNIGNEFSNSLQEVVVVGYGRSKSSAAAPPKIEFEKIKVAVNLNVKFILER